MVRAARSAQQSEVPHRNDVVVVGRVTGVPRPRELPSGDEVTTWRMVVHRPPESRRAAGRNPGYDVLDCAAWNARVRNSATRWQVGDVLELTGALRRRFWRTPGGVQSRCEVEVTSATRLVKAAGPA